ncbi:mitochondrial 37S ribosomal protein mS47 [Aspergillus homomorphus CBS 101889]|uniref:3-hydroxyisobutyryl-CoA hydrolase n=1 Tax=Aspergillus homomorphus (strain CBS 101889) TaxID=1450537 RepID=A0A395I4V9_ASPHC|nr:ClpP/crotonase [Aspergillus homomorphus CBS 101889]RAL14613.1 ClpP/crotonase [Aspergillus homomorphus CBS 101889]
MLVRRSFCRFPTPSSWISRVSPASMPLRAKVTNPAFTAPAANMSTAPKLNKASDPQSSEPDDVLFYSHYGVRLVELNRPKKLNALNGSMAMKILPRLQEWEKSQLANVIMLSGAGTKALCAGGDVASLALQNEQGPKGQKASADFFKLEYILDHFIATYRKPIISVMDGITMGGGVGLSVHAPFRIATERTVFAMPETSIGFFPDVGASFFLPRLDGQLGTYLALTGQQMHGVQTLLAGIATHYLDSSVLSLLTARLSELVFGDHASRAQRLDLVNRTIAEFSSKLPPAEEQVRTYNGGIRQAIDRCFKFDTVEEIMQALEKETESTGWARKTLEQLSTRSPTSLKVALRQMRLGQSWSISEAFQREHHMATLFMSHPDFVEGVKTKLISKSGKPVWQPATLAEIASKDVDRFFTYFKGEEPLELLSERDYQEYPYNYGLPSEKDIKEFLSNQNDPESDVFKNFLRRFGGKPGVREKMADVMTRKVHQGPEGKTWS